MSWVLTFAVYMVLWWTVLFAVLPIRLKTQDDEKNVTLGTVSSAPGKSRHVAMAMLWTTILSLAIFLAFYAITSTLGLSLNDIPHIVPEFD